MKYIWQLENFPDFSFTKEKIIPIIQLFTLELGEINGMLVHFDKTLNQDIFVETMLFEALKTSEIEGEFFSREEVMSSLKANLNVKNYHSTSKNLKANAIAHLMIEIQKCYYQPLTLEMLLDWHKILMLNEENINAGELRKGTEPIQVISGRFGKIAIHYEAPPSTPGQTLLNFKQ